MVPRESDVPIELRIVSPEPGTKLDVVTREGEEKQVQLFKWNDKDRAWGMEIDYDHPNASSEKAFEVFNESVTMVADEGGGGRARWSPFHSLLPSDSFSTQQRRIRPCLTSPLPIRRGNRRRSFATARSKSPFGATRARSLDHNASSNPSDEQTVRTV